MATSTNYGWAEPDNSSLVKNGASDMRTLGNAIDTSLWNVGYGNAGKNKIINGAFDFWQRGTTTSSGGTVYLADRWCTQSGSTAGFTYSQNTFTQGTAPVSGYEGQYFADVAGTITSATTGYIQLEQRIESVRTFANQTITLSFWAKGSTSGTINTVLEQYFGNTGSPSASVLSGLTSFNITTAWTRFSVTITLPSIAGKTITTNDMLKVVFVKNMGSSYSTYGTSNYTGTLSIWGVQLEAGSVATPFSRATGTIQGELAACQRYYYQLLASGSSTGRIWGNGYAQSATTITAAGSFPVTMRTVPSLSATTGTSYYNFYVGSTYNFDSITLDASTTASNWNVYNSTVAGRTTGQAAQFYNNNTSAAIGFSAEL